MEIEKEPIDQWCKCERKGTCMGCMIQELVREHLGMDGEEYMTMFIPSMSVGKAIGLPIAYALSSATPSRAISHMSMGMGAGMVNR